MADHSRLKATSSFASDATVHKPGSCRAPSPLGQKASLQPSFTDEKSTTMAAPPRAKTAKQRLLAAKTLVLTYLKKYWFLVGLAFVILLGWAVPDVARKGGYIRAEWTIKWGAVIIIFLISGLSLRTKILTQTFLRIRLHLLVQSINLVFIPFFVFGFVMLLFKLRVAMNSLVLMGIVIAASTPTTVSSNVVMTKNAKGNEATALMNAAVGNVLGIFVSPALVDLFQEPLILATPENEPISSGGSIDFLSVLKQLGITVLVPLVVGQVIQIIWTEKVAKFKAKLYLGEVSSVALLTMVWSVFSDAFHSGSFNTVSATDIVAVCIINACFYILFSLLSLFLAYIPVPSFIQLPSWIERLRYSREDTVAVMYCGATKTVAMGVPLINVLYESGDPGTVGVLSTPLLLYHVEQLILGNIEVDILKKWVLRGKEAERQMPPERDEEDQMPTDTSSSGLTSPKPRSPGLLSPPRALVHSSPPISPADTLPVKQLDLVDAKSPLPPTSPVDTLHEKPDGMYKAEGHSNVQPDDHPDDRLDSQFDSQPSSQPSSQLGGLPGRPSDRQPDDQSEIRTESQFESKLSTTNLSPAHSTQHINNRSTTSVATSAQAATEPPNSVSEREEAAQKQPSRTPFAWDDEVFSSPLFTSDTASISLDTSRFSTDTLSPPTLSHPPTAAQRHSRRSHSD